MSMADLARLGFAMQRAATVLLRGTGGRAVTLRMPRPGVAGEVAEQLGLGTPTFDAVELAPTMLRPLDGAGAGGQSRWELLVAASAMAEVLNSHQVVDALALLAASGGVLADGVLMQVESVSHSEVSGVPCVYRLTLRQATDCEL